jgi:hypothetical protein
MQGWRTASLATSALAMLERREGSAATSPTSGGSLPFLTVE